MSRIMEVIKNKNKIEKTQRLRRQEELQGLKNASAYKASLSEGLQHIKVLLDSGEIDSVTVQIPDKSLKYFSNAIYSAELAEYDVTQVPDKSNEFIIRYKLI